MGIIMIPVVIKGRSIIGKQPSGNFNFAGAVLAWGLLTGSHPV